MLWLPLTLKYLQSRDKISQYLYMFAVIVVLFMVALTSIKQYLIVEKLIPTNKNNISSGRTLITSGKKNKRKST